ncbi:MAG: hypothetical protein JNM86_16115 [Phycisphaerae bacterium]|nr:hypothetical protein [Phycisphaerae bacterium]
MPTFGSYEARREVAGAGFCARWEASLSASASVPGVKPFGDRFVATAVGPTVIVPWLPRAGLDEEARRLVGAARDQAQLVGAGAKRWSIVADFGLMDDGRGAFVVRPSLAWTVERLVLAQYVFTSVELRGIVLGVVDGLLELERSSGRQWGNLNSSTVMLAVGPGDAKLGDGSGVVLTELESRERLGTDAAIADLRALGRLIYEMVLSKRPPLKAVSGWSAKWSEGWEVVGDGRWWFELANRLMSAGTALGEGGNPPTLAQVRQLILEHRAHKPLPKRQLYIAGGIAALVLLAGGAYLALHSPGREPIVLTADQLDEKARLGRWQGLVERWRLWFGDLYASREQVSTIAATRPAGSTIRAVSAVLNDPGLRDPRAISGVGASGSLLDLFDRPGDAIEGDKIVAAAESLDKIEEIRRLLLEWPELARLKDVADQWEKRGWGAASGPLRTAAEGVSPAIPNVIIKEGETATTDAGSSRPGAVVPAVMAGQEAISIAEAIEADWDGLLKAGEERSKEAADSAARDPVLSKLRAIATKEAARAIASAEAGKPALAALAERLATLETLTGEVLAQRQIDGWDEQGFLESDQLKQIAAGEESVDQLAAWKALAAKPEFAEVDAIDPRVEALARFKDAEEQLRSTGQRLADMGKGGHELTLQPSEFDARMSELASEAKVLASTAWSNRNRSKVEGLSERLIRNIDALQRDANDALRTGLMPLSEAIGTQNRELFSSAALSRDWTRTLDGAAGVSSKREAFNAVRKRRDELLALDRAIPNNAVIAFPESLGFSTEAWKRAAGAARERFFAEALRTDPPDVAGAAERSKSWLAQAEEYLSLAAKVENALRRGEELSGAHAGSTLPDSLPNLVRRLDAIPSAAELGSVVPSVSGAISELKAFATTEDAARLVNAIRGATADSAPIALGAWARLAEIGWPRATSDFAVAKEFAATKIPELIDKGIDSATRELVRERAGARSRRIWLAFMNSRKGVDRAGIDAAMSNAGLFGVTPGDESDLSTAARYNALVWDLAHKAAEFASVQKEKGIGPAAPEAALAAQTQVAKELLASFRAGSAALGLAGTDAATKLAGAMERIADRDAKPAFDPLKSGPAALRNAQGQPLWKGEKVGGAIVYSLDLPPGRLAPGQSAVKLVFQPVSITGPGGPIATYVSTHEVSVGSLIGAFEAQRGRQSWEQLQKTLRHWDFDKDDPRPGPATWSWDLRRVKVILSDRSKESVAWKDQTGWLKGHPTMQGKNYYAPELGEIAPPNYDSPMDWVSPDAALLAARQMGVRLPTVDEWKAAVEAAGGQKKASAGENRRDKTWLIQFQYIDKLDVIGKEWPHAGIFWPKNLVPQWPQADGKMLYVNASDDSSLPINDGYLWFAPAMRDSDGWSNLIGNVSEIVLDGPADEMASVEPTAEAVRPFVEKFADKWRVAGASALSGIVLRGNKDYDPAEPYENKSLREARMGYADVGFRLAFSEGGTGRPAETPAVLLAQALAGGAYLDGE